MTSSMPQPAEQASPEMMSAALNIATSQRDQALNEIIRIGAQLTLAHREIARLQQELEAAKRPTPASSKTPPTS